MATGRAHDAPLVGRVARIRAWWRRRSVPTQLATVAAFAALPGLLATTVSVALLGYPRLAVGLAAVAFIIGATVAWVSTRFLHATRREIDAMRSQLQQRSELERTRGDFVSTVSHELRTPLTALRGSLGLVLHGATGEQLPPRAVELLRIAKRNTDRLIRLTNGILDTERLDSDDEPLRVDACDVAALLHATAATLEPMASERRVTIAVDAPDPVAVSGDPDRLIQVFTNLLANAIRYSPAGEYVRVTMRVEEDEVRVRVADRGPGIAPEFRSRIFGRFQRAHDASDIANGAGLGLSISRAIVHRHDGTIAFHCPPEGGTTFTVALPMPSAGGASGAD